MAAFGDLLTRTGTGVALAAVGLGSIWAGGAWFAGLAAIAVGVMLWEMGRLTDLEQPGMAALAVLVAVLGALLFFVAAIAESPRWLLLLIVPTIFGFAALSPFSRGYRPDAPSPWPWALGSIAVVMAGYVAVELRAGGGVVWMLWLILTVVVTDIAGYFAGRAIGGKKFWPSVSPKKTWAGVLAGWLGAGAVGAAFMPLTNTGEGLILVSIFLSFASQMGDILESALKRRAGVKDSSNLLPGHGGLLDRLDGVVGALLITGLVALLTNYPEAPI